MSQIYVSGPWSFASGVLQVVKSIKVKSRVDKVVYSEKGTEYQFSKLEQSDYVVFVLDGFAWQQKLESTEIDENLNFKGIAGTADNFYQIVNGQFGTIVASNPFTGVLKVNNDGGYTIQDEGVYLKGELLGDPLDFLNVEQPKSYFY